MRNIFTTILAIVFVALQAWPQTGTSSPISAPAHPNPNTILVEGTPVRMRITRTISSADAEVGQNVDFEVLDTIRIGRTVVIPRGSIAMGTVTEAQPKRRMGRGGKLNVNIDYVRMPNMDKLPLRGVKELKGGGRAGAMTGAMVVTGIVFFPAAPLFLFMHGKDMTIPKGHEVTVYTNTDYDISSPVGSPEKAMSIAAVTPNAPPVSAVQSVAPAATKASESSLASKTGSSTVTAQTPGNTSRNILTNSSVLTLNNAGISEELILQTIDVSAANYQLDPTQIVELKHAGLSDAIISAMMRASQR